MRIVKTASRVLMVFFVFFGFFAVLALAVIGVAVTASVAAFADRFVRPRLLAKRPSRGTVGLAGRGLYRVDLGGDPQ